MTLSLILKCTVALNAEYFQLLRAAVYVGNIRQYCRKKMVTVCLKVDCIKKRSLLYCSYVYFFGRSGSEQEERNMSLQFIMGNSGAGKSRYAYQKILAEAMRHPEKTYLIIVPEQFTMQTQKELVSLHPAGGILNVDILSFQRLAYRIFEETGGSLYPVLEETGKSLVVKRVAQEKKKELTILGSTLKRTGAVSQMKSLISELKQYQIAPSELDTWAEETGEKKLLAAKLKDTGVIYRAFEEYLENRYVTAEDVLEVLAGKLKNHHSFETVRYWWTDLPDLRQYRSVCLENCSGFVKRSM